MKRIVTLLIVLVAVLLLSAVFLLYLRGRGGAGGTVTEGQDQVSPQEQPADNGGAEEIASSVAENPVPAGRNTANAGESAANGAVSGRNDADHGGAAESGESAANGAGSDVKSAADTGDGAGGASASSATGASTNAAASGDSAGGAAAGSGANQAAGGAQAGSAPGRRPSSPIAGADPAFGRVRIPDVPGGPESYHYFEYQVIAVTKKVLAEAVEYLKLPKDSQPTDELLPAIYHVGGYRVIGYSAGYATAVTPVELRMSRSEYFPDFYILPKSESDESSFSDGELPPPDMDDEDEDEDGEDAEDGEDDSDGEDDEDAEDDLSSDNNKAVSNNLASVFPFFGDPTVFGNEFFLDLRPPRIFSMESNMRKLSGFSNADYGDWGNAQSPIFDDNSFASVLASTRGKPMIVAKNLSGSTWILHVFFTQPLPTPETTAPAPGSENKIVRLDFRIVRAKWNDILSTGYSDGCPAVPSDDFLRKLSESPQVRDQYSPTFRLVPSQGPVSIQLNAKTQFVPLKWFPAQEYGVPAIPLDTGVVWTGTVMQAAARVLSDEKTVLLDYRFEKATQTGWRNYTYSFYGFPEEEPAADPMNRYARPLLRDPEPEILSGMVKLPMIDTTAFRQTLYLELGKPVLAARISNPAYQPDTLTLLFVTATVEDPQ